MNMLCYQHVTIDCGSFMYLARGSYILCKHKHDPKAWHDIVSGGEDQVASVMNDQGGPAVENYRRFVFS